MRFHFAWSDLRTWRVAFFRGVDRTRLKPITEASIETLSWERCLSMITSVIGGWSRTGGRHGVRGEVRKCPRIVLFDQFDLLRPRGKSAVRARGEGTGQLGGFRSWLFDELT